MILILLLQLITCYKNNLMELDNFSVGGWSILYAYGLVFKNNDIYINKRWNNSPLLVSNHLNLQIILFMFSNNKPNQFLAHWR